MNKVTHFIRTHRVLLIGVIAAVVLASVGLGIYRQAFTFDISSTTPGTASAIPAGTPVVSINLNKQVAADGVSIKGPDGVRATYTVNGSRVDINIFSPLDTDKTYTFHINSIKSRDGYEIRDRDVTFTTNNSADLTDAERALIIKRQEANDTGGVGDPVFDKTPYSSGNYTISAYPQGTSDGKGSVNIEITVFVSQEQADNPNDPTVAASKQQALAYLSSIGVTASARYIITYTVQGS